MTHAPAPFNILIVGQSGRLEAEAVLFAASLARACPGFPGRLIVAEPQPGPLWPGDPRISPGHRDLLEGFGAEIRPFQSRHFGAAYPNGNKIEGLAVLPPGEPFLFCDSDTLVLGDVSVLAPHLARPAASMRRSATWPREEVYWPGYGAIWRSLYDLFGLDFESSLDRSMPDEWWERYLYFNAGWFCGPDPARFHQHFLDMATRIRDDPPEALALQPLDPWLDQVALPLAIHALGGGRPGPELARLDGELTCHYRLFPLLYAREEDRVVAALEAAATPNAVKRVLKAHRPLQKMVYQGQGREVRALFDREALPAREADLRKAIRAAGYWMR
ncbi:hypothetical protein [Wenxinia saemankumensis]|uniref:Uncharacterized protein n=1 Tax=Wenxinia saemankumensis TaxID=1447782 RepID=A0A1M6ET53_9RHOB|nr:hypothetical protein [Wenxinia saemankumensis]SHI88588.1 hypothetical protein SAMN05444417_2158 [Wenxinia saemankumensis]